MQELLQLFSFKNFIGMVDGFFESLEYEKVRKYRTQFMEIRS